MNAVGNATALPRLSADKLEAFTLTCVRALRRLEGDVWAHEPTLLGWDHVAVELLGVVPSVEMPAEREIAP